jgi:3-deoxy-manno-octulosonate cytidylyltransferase (CMP-KDO synthetase)
VNKVACIIPARLKSTRFPQKILAPLGGRPLIQRVWEAATQVPHFDTIAFAIDAPETAAVIESFGGKYFMTSIDCPSGTMRLAELQASGLIDADIFVNWQADEPFIHTNLIEDLLQTADKKDADVWTLKKKIANPDQILSPHIPKVVTDENGYALYFSRSPIPHYLHDLPADQTYFKHIGIYAYTAEALDQISNFVPSPLERAEYLEQLTFLYHGLKVRVHETIHEVFGIDMPEHMAKAETYFLGVSK